MAERKENVKKDSKSKKVAKKKTNTENKDKKKSLNEKKPTKKIAKKKNIEADSTSYSEKMPTEVLDSKIINEEKMLSNNDFSLLGIIILFIVAIILVSLYSYLLYVRSFSGREFRALGMYQEPLFKEDFKRIISLDQFQTMFPQISTNQLNFNEKDYVVIAVKHDPCGENNLKPVGYTLNNGVLTVRLNYQKSCGLCAFEYLYYLLELDKDVFYDTVNFDYRATNNPHCDNTMVYKPIIYIYPEEKTNVKVTLGNSNLLKFTYPTYNDYWEVEAYPDGKLFDKTGREYYALFWEGIDHNAKIQDDGFVIKGHDTKEFLENVLSKLGLNDKEANEFIIYWLPQLEDNKYNYIRFETIDEINTYMPLIVEPKPNNIIRIQMDYLPLTEPIKVKEQVLETPIRSGYTVVEWGGSKIKE